MPTIVLGLFLDSSPPQSLTTPRYNIWHKGPIQADSTNQEGRWKYQWYGVHVNIWNGYKVTVERWSYSFKKSSIVYRSCVPFTLYVLAQSAVYVSRYRHAGHTHTHVSLITRFNPLSKWNCDVTDTSMRHPVVHKREVSVVKVQLNPVVNFNVRFTHN